MNIKEAIQTVNELHSLNDAVYAVRENANSDGVPAGGSSWDHPDVERYRNALSVLEAEGCLDELELEVDIPAMARKLLTSGNYRIDWGNYEAGALEIVVDGNGDVKDAVREILDLPNILDHTAIAIHEATRDALSLILKEAR